MGHYGALVLRGIFIFLGIELLAAFHWLIYIFGGILIITGVKMAFGGEEKIEPEKNLLVKLVRRFIYHHQALAWPARAVHAAIRCISIPIRSLGIMAAGGSAAPVLLFERETFEFIIKEKRVRFADEVARQQRRLKSHDRYPRFFEFGDAENYSKGLERLRQELGTGQEVMNKKKGYGVGCNPFLLRATSQRPAIV